MALRLLHLSDTHLSSAGNPPHPRDPRGDPAQRLKRVLEEVGRHTDGFDAVLLTGDLTDDRSEEAAQAVRAAVAGLAPVILAVPGNHDDPDVIGAVFGVVDHDLGGVHLAGADTTVRGETAGIGASVRLVLAGLADPGRTILLTHHPVRSRSTHPWFVLPDAEETARALAERPPLAVLSGHTHETYAATGPGGTRLLGAPSTYYGIAHNGLEWARVDGTAGAAILAIDGDQVDYRPIYA